jgi:hypothetical protein
MAAAVTAAAVTAAAVTAAVLRQGRPRGQHEGGQ